MRLEGFDVVFGLATPAIDLFIEHASVSLVQIRDNEARVGPFGASLDAGDDALYAAPAFGAVEELLEAAYFVVSWRGLEASLRAGLEDFDVSAQGRGWRNAEDNRDRSPDTIREPRGCSNGCRPAAGSQSWASWRGSRARDGAGRPRFPCRRAVWRAE